MKYFIHEDVEWTNKKHNENYGECAVDYGFFLGFHLLMIVSHFWPRGWQSVNVS